MKKDIHPFPSKSKKTRPGTSKPKNDDARYDAVLVDRFNNRGDQTAFTEIVQRYYGRIVMVAQNTLHNAADAQDIAQETFIRAYRGLATFRGESSLISWLYCIALNLARNRYWYFFRRRRHDTLSLDQALDEAAPMTLTDILPDKVSDPRLETINREFVDLVDQCMAGLDPYQREILVMRNVLHRSYGEIGRALGINVGTVKSRIARARANLRSLILQTAPEFGMDAEMQEFFESSRQTQTPMAIAS